MDLEALCRRPAAIQPLVQELARKLVAYEVDAVCGPLNEGAFVALMVANELGCDFAYAERFPDPGNDALFPVRYRVPAALRPFVAGRRVAIVNDVISAGSAVRGTLADLRGCGAPRGRRRVPAHDGRHVRGVCRTAGHQARDAGAPAVSGMDSSRLSAL